MTKLPSPRTFKLYLFIGLFALFLTSTTKIQAAAVNMTMSPVTVNVGSGQSFEVALNINTGGDQLTTAEAYLTFDPAKVRVDSITKGTFLPELLDQLRFDNTAGTASVVMGSGLPTVNPPAQGTGTLATVKFTAIGSGNTAISYATNSQTYSKDQTGNSLNSTAGANVVIGGATAPLATPIVTTAPSNPTKAPAATPNNLSGRKTINFDDASGKDRVLNGQYPTGVIDWGTNLWYLSAPWQKFTTKSFSFNGPANVSEAQFNLLSPGHLESIQAYNGGILPSTVILSCQGQPNIVTTVNQTMAPITINTGWTGNCQNIKLSSSNGWNTNFDNLVIAEPTLAPIVTPMPSPSVLPTSTPNTQIINFDNIKFKNRALNGQYPTGVIDWGTNQWFLSAPWKQFTTNSFSFNGPKIYRASFKFLTPKTLVSIKAYNGGTQASAVSLRCVGQPIKTVNVNVNQMITIDTNWLSPCEVVTINSTNGWNTNFDDLTIK